MLGERKPAGKHGRQRGILHACKRLAARCDLVGPTDVKVDDVIGLAEVLLDLLLVLLPSLLVGFELFVLVLTLLRKLGLLSSQLIAFIL